MCASKSNRPLLFNCTCILHKTTTTNYVTLLQNKGMSFLIYIYIYLYHIKIWDRTLWSGLNGGIHIDRPYAYGPTMLFFNYYWDIGLLIFQQNLTFFSMHIQKYKFEQWTIGLMSRIYLSPKCSYRKSNIP